jgi:hypothetical protein
MIGVTGRALCVRSAPPRPGLDQAKKSAVAAVHDSARRADAPHLDTHDENTESSCNLGYSCRRALDNDACQGGAP